MNEEKVDPVSLMGIISKLHREVEERGGKVESTEFTIASHSSRTGKFVFWSVSIGWGGKIYIHGVDENGKTVFDESRVIA